MTLCRIEFAGSIWPYVGSGAHTLPYRFDSGITAPSERLTMSTANSTELPVACGPIRSLTS